jgi:hypothetical protein
MGADAMEMDMDADVMDMNAHLKKKVINKYYIRL